MSSSRSIASAMRMWRSSASGGRQARASSRSRATTARDLRSLGSSTTSSHRVRRPLRAARAGGRSRSDVRVRCRASGHRQADLPRGTRTLASRRGACTSPPRSGAGRRAASARRARSCFSSPRGRRRGYEEALRETGLPTYRAAGRGYFGQQQTVDLLAYLRLLQNRYDDEALLTVLASPLVGRFERRARTAPPFGRAAARSSPAWHARVPEGVSDQKDRRLFGSLPAALRPPGQALADGSGSSVSASEVVAEHDYDLAVLAHWDGRRRYANLRKLARLARSFEDLAGRTSRDSSASSATRRRGRQGGRGRRRRGRRRGACAS